MSRVLIRLFGVLIIHAFSRSSAALTQMTCCGVPRAWVMRDGARSVIGCVEFERVVSALPFDSFLNHKSTIHSLRIQLHVYNLCITNPRNRSYYALLSFSYY